MLKSKSISKSLLQTVRNDGHLPLWHLTWLCKQAAGGIAYLTSMKKVHYDIAARNYL